MEGLTWDTFSSSPCSCFCSFLLYTMCVYLHLLLSAFARHMRFSQRRKAWDLGDLGRSIAWLLMFSLFCFCCGGDVYRVLYEFGMQKAAFCWNRVRFFSFVFEKWYDVRAPRTTSLQLGFQDLSKRILQSSNFASEPVS